MALVLIGPATLFCVLQLLVPVAILFRYSLNRFDPAAYMVEAVTAENYVKFFTDPYYLTVLARTIRVSLVSTLICLVMGFPARLLAGAHDVALEEPHGDPRGAAALHRQRGARGGLDDAVRRQGLHQ